MTRGNQRDLAREKNAKKTATKNKGNAEGLTVAERKERDAQILREKQAKKAAAAASAPKGPSPAKKS
ncbi:hypothetical protein Pelo_12266 [Pelomyxa schiedti]|nr:hypothetical protein Pelo_12266 [Pelomyxa schiedti]